MTLSCVLLWRKIKEVFASIYSLIVKVFTLVECFKSMAGEWDLIIGMLYFMYWSIVKGKGKRMWDTIEIYPLSQWLIFLLHKFYFGCKLPSYKTNGSYYHYWSQNLLWREWVRWTLLCFDWSYQEYTLTPDWLE